MSRRVRRDGGIGPSGRQATEIAPFSASVFVRLAMKSSQLTENSYRERFAPIGVGLTLAIIAVVYLSHYERALTNYHSDLDVQLAGARFLLAGRNPYQLIGPGREFRWGGTLYHPAPTLILISPLAGLGLATARAVFVAITVFLFGFAMVKTRQPPWRYVMLLTIAAQSALLLVQWSFLLAAAWLLPWVASVLVVKPNIAAAIVGARLEKRFLWPVLVGSVALISVSFIVAPHWPRWWLESLAADPNRSAAIARSGGFLLLLSGLKWRRSEARLLLLLSIVPQTLGHYDALLLFFVPDRASQAIALAALSHFLNLLNLGDRPATLNDAVVASGIRVVHYLYLPSLLFVLSRPNRGTIPEWAEKVARRLPAWLQGAPHRGEGPQGAREFFKSISSRWNAWSGVGILRSWSARRLNDTHGRQ